MKKAYTTDSLRKLPFSSAWRAGDFIYTSGHAATRDDAGRELTTIEDQTRQTLENLKKTLALVGSGLEDVIKVNIFLCDNKLFFKMNEVYRGYFRDPLPARSCAITGLAADVMLLEVECIAYKPLKQTS
jgi:enamine deaminase RidA (YjgF/YER057c/UK114 family)